MSCGYLLALHFPCSGRKKLPVINERSFHRGRFLAAPKTITVYLNRSAVLTGFKIDVLYIEL
jgi:hypothetical protein